MNAVAVALRSSSSTPAMKATPRKTTPSAPVAKPQRACLLLRGKPRVPRCAAAARAAPDGAAHAAVLEHVGAAEPEEEYYYDSDYECPMFIPEVPTLMRCHHRLSHYEFTHGAYAAYDAEVEEREHELMSRVALAGVIYPEAPGVAFKPSQ